MNKSVIVVFFSLITLMMSPLVSEAEEKSQIREMTEMEKSFNNAKFNNEENLKAEKVEEKKKGLDATLQEAGIAEEEIREVGDFYYDKTRDKFVLQIKNDIKDSSKKEKFDKLKSKSKNENTKMSNLTTSEGDILIESVKYSNEELIEFQDQFFKVNNPEQFSQNTNLNLDTINNKLELVTDSIEENLKKSLEKTYGDLLYVKVDPNFKDEHELLKARKEDWNQLGAGIGIRDPNGSSCTTAGIAYNTSRHFIVTAGHCINPAGYEVSFPVRQWHTNVGTTHLNSINSGFDFGLIRIDRSNELPGGRSATDGYYIDGSNPYGYDVKLSGIAKPYISMPVCKSGIRTGYTCGEVTNNRTIHPGTGLIGIKVSSSNPSFACKGDSGSALTYKGGGIYRTVGVLSAGATATDCSSTVYFTPLVEMLEKYGIYYYSSDTPRQL